MTNPNPGRKIEDLINDAMKEKELKGFMKGRRWGEVIAFEDGDKIEICSIDEKFEFKNYKPTHINALNIGWLNREEIVYHHHNETKIFNILSKEQELIIRTKKNNPNVFIPTIREGWGENSFISIYNPINSSYNDFDIFLMDRNKKKKFKIIKNVYQGTFDVSKNHDYILFQRRDGEEIKALTYHLNTKEEREIQGKPLYWNDEKTLVKFKEIADGKRDIVAENLENKEEEKLNLEMYDIGEYVKRDRGKYIPLLSKIKQSPNLSRIAINFENHISLFDIETKEENNFYPSMLHDQKDIKEANILNSYSNQLWDSKGEKIAIRISNHNFNSQGFVIYGFDGRMKTTAYAGMKNLCMQPK